MTGIGIVGNLALDRVAGSASPRVGGAVYYGARAAARLGVDAVAVARCAPEDTAVCLAPLEGLGLPVVWHAAAATAAFSFHYEGDRRVMQLDAVGDPWRPEDVTGWAAAALERAGWVHVGALVRSDFDRATLAALGAGRRLLVDAQGLVRLPEPGPLQRDGEMGPSLFALLDVLKLSESEALALAGSTDPARLRALGVPEVVLTLGSRGSLVVTAGHAEHVAAEPVEDAADPTGAGDSFSLAYVAARAAGAHPVEAARSASAFVSDLLAHP